MDDSLLTELGAALVDGSLTREEFAASYR